MRFSTSFPHYIERPRILEIGCGNSWLAERPVSFGTVTGVDLADEAIEDARRRVPSGELHSGDILERSQPPNSFDVIGLLRVVNSAKVTSSLSRMFSRARVMRVKERLGFGQTLVVRARKRR